MDLLACLTAAPDSTLSIYRLLSEDKSPKLLSEKITGIGTALSWSPCGRKIAVGDRLGGVTIYDGETGAVLHARQLHEHPVRALSWVGTGVGGDVTAEPPWSHMLPPLLTMPSAPSNMYTELPVADVEPDVSNGLSLLVSADDGGLVTISAGGTFPLQATQVSCGGPLQVSSPLQREASFGVSHLSDGRSRQLDSRRLASVRLSPDLRHLAVLLGAPGSALSPDAGNGGLRSPLAELSGLSPVIACGAGSPLSADVSNVSAGGVGSASDTWPNDEVVVVLDVRKLAVRQRELAQCSSMAERLLAVTTYTKKAVATLGSVWKGAADAFANKMRTMSDAVEDKENNSIHQELLITCCMGNPSDAVHSFLTRQTSPQQLQRLERNVLQAIEYVNLVVCTRLQVAGHNILTILHELHACASWTQKFKSIGLDIGLLRGLMAQTQRFLHLTELLLMECSEARRFVRTLFQVLIRQSQKLSDQPITAEPGASAPLKEDMDAFIACMQQNQSLELSEVTGRISGAAPAVMVTSPAGGRLPRQLDAASAQPSSIASSLLESTQRLAADAEKVGEFIVEALSSHVSVLACIPVHAPSPWASIGLPEVKAAAKSDFAAGVPCPRGFGSSTLSMTWESLGPGLGVRLILLWSGGGAFGAELHMCRVALKPAPPGTIPPVKLERARVTAGGMSSSLASPGGSSSSRLPAHFVLCQMYDPSHIAAVVLEEQPTAPGGALATVCLIDVSLLDFSAVPRLGGATSDAISDDVSPQTPLPVAVSLEGLPEGALRRSVILPQCYVWSSAMRCMSSRGVCSVYAWRARRLLTLDMDAEADDDEEIDEDVGD